MAALRTTTIALFLALLTVTSVLAGGPPLITDDANTVDVGRVEIELNGAYTYDRETDIGVTTKCSRAEAEMKATTGLSKNLGISLAIPYNINQQVKENDQVVDKTGGFGDMTIELKHAFAELGGIKFAIKPSIVMPTGNYGAGLSEGRWQVGTTLIVTSEFADGKYALHANLGYEHHSYRTDEVRDATRSELWSSSIAGEIEIAKGLFVVADLGLATTADRSTAELSTCALAGARYEINEFLDINAGVKLGLTAPEDDVSILYGLALKY